jgi:hypothetical protein
MDPVGLAILIVGAWLVVGIIAWTNSRTPADGGTGDPRPKCGDCNDAQRKWRNMDGWAKAAAFLTYSGIMLNCALKGCKISY